MKKYKLLEVSKILGISRATVYRLVKRHAEILKDNIETDTKGVLLLTKEGVSILSRETGKKTENKTAETGDETTGILKKMLEETLQTVKKKDTIIEKMIENQEKDKERQAQERERTDTIIMKLTQDLENTRKLIENKKTSETKKTDKVISIEEFINTKIEKDLEKSNYEVEKKKNKDPLQGRSSLYKIYIKMFHPDRMRKSV